MGLRVASPQEGEISSWKGVIIHRLSAEMLCNSPVQDPHTKAVSHHPGTPHQGYHTMYISLPGGSERESKLSKVTQPASGRAEM